MSQSSFIRRFVRLRRGVGWESNYWLTKGVLVVGEEIHFFNTHSWDCFSQTIETERVRKYEESNKHFSSVIHL